MCIHQRGPAIEKGPPEVMIHGIASSVWFRYSGIRKCWVRGRLPVKDVFVIGNWIWCLPWRVIVVLAAVFIHKLVLFSTGFSKRKCRTNAHGCQREGRHTMGYYWCRKDGAD